MSDNLGVRGGTVGRGSALRVRRTRVRFPMGLMGLLIGSPTGLTMALGSTNLLKKCDYQWNLLGGKGGRCIGLTTFLRSRADCVEIMGASSFWRPKGLSRSVEALLCFVLLCFAVLKYPQFI